MTRHHERPPDQLDLDLPEPEPVLNAGTLVKAWCDGWATTHAGRQPHTAVLRKVSGICRNLARDCLTVDSWREAWRAAYATGREGRYDIVGHLAEPAAPSAHGNLFADHAVATGTLNLDPPDIPTDPPPAVSEQPPVSREVSTTRRQVADVVEQWGRRYDAGRD